MRFDRIVNCLAFSHLENFGYQSYVYGLVEVLKSKDTLFLFPSASKEYLIERYSGDSDVFLHFNNRVFLSFFTLKFCYNFIDDAIVIHTMNYGPILSLGTNDVIILHDLKWRHRGYPASYLRRIQRRVWTKIAISRGSRFIAISNWTAFDFFCEFGKQVDKIIPNFIVENAGKLATLSIEKFKISKPYFLIVSSNQKYKDLDYAIAQFCSYNEKSKQYQLVIVSSVYTTQNDVIVLNYLHSDELMFLIKHCEALLQPSLFEGFGLPYYEAINLSKDIIAYSNPVAIFIACDYGRVYLYDKVSTSLRDILENRNLRIECDSVNAAFSRDTQIQLYNQLL